MSRKTKSKAKLQKMIRSVGVSPDTREMISLKHSYIFQNSNQGSMASPAKSNISHLDRPKSYALTNIKVKKKEQQVGFLEYASDMYAKLARIQKNRGQEESHTAVLTKPKNPFSAARAQRAENPHVTSIKVEECRRGLNAINMNEFTSKE
jgi:hypothetical protein